MSNPIIAAPIVNADVFPTFIDARGISKDAVRWLFYPGDVIHPRRKRELRDKMPLYEANIMGFLGDGKPFYLLAAGGDEVGSVCLARTKQTIPRCLLTPLETRPDWTPPDQVPMGSDVWQGSMIQEQQNPVAGLVGSPFGGNKQGLPGVKMWPGEAIAAILHTARNGLAPSTGLVDVEALVGINWQDAIREGIQNFFFPDYPDCLTVENQPVTLRRIEEMLRDARKRSQSGSMFDQAADEMLSACDQFRNWSYTYIKGQETLVSQAAQGGFVHTFSEVCESLMAQIEYTPEKRRMESVTTQTAELTGLIAQIAARPGSNDELLAKLVENQTYLMQAVAGLAGQKSAEEEKAKPQAPKIPKVS